MSSLSDSDDGNYIHENLDVVMVTNGKSNIVRRNMESRS